MGKGKLILIGVVVFFVAMGAFSVYRGSQPGKFDDFAKCLTDKDVKMFGAYWCPHCADQKNHFGRSFKYVNYVECAQSGSNLQTQVCADNNIESYPTWEFSDGTRQSSVLSIEALADLSGCTQ